MNGTEVAGRRLKEQRIEQSAGNRDGGFGPERPRTAISNVEHVHVFVH